ncbi:cytochrome P450 [Cryphonectria parasitica EP155]|uniref:Cytochrome P450 n=1 Tax=Cryphonectria parasitica (strain ATCC 38755 / EP155) TaxID=660469 RepID=A0A9P5CPB2_CRYP1|nr:cytochrome P450 [Cryphonectria parasitica EP155]KAF3765993.1 cytochrome P450 [Cryphonectria parasitica EP155]
MISSSLVIKGVLVLFVLYILYTVIWEVFFSPLRRIPGPHAARFTRLWYFTRVANANFQHENTTLHRKYGPLVRITPSHVSIDDPSAIKTIYGIGARFPKSDWYQGSRAPGKRVVTTLFSEQDIKVHAESRKQFQNVYSMSSLVSYETFVDECADLFAQRLDEMAARGARGGGGGGGDRVDMAHWFQAYAFDVIACITFGGRFGFLDAGEDIRGMMAQLHDVMRYASLVGIFPRVHDWIFYPSARLGLFGSAGRVAHMDFVRRRMAVREEERKLHGGIHKARAERGSSSSGSTPRDFTDRLWDRHDENPDKTTKDHIFMVGLSNITAGSDTTASTLSGLLYHLLVNPRVLARLEDEIMGFATSGKLSERPTFDETRQMPYLDAVVKEALRLHSAVGLPLWRVVPEGGVEVAGHFLPAGTNVGVNAWTAHRNEEVWGRDAEVFRPERWLEAQAEADVGGNKARLQRMEAYYLPFGLGSRTCIGRHISILEISKLVPRLLRDFAFELARPGEEMQCEDFWFVLPKSLAVKVRRRSTSNET